MPSNSGDGPPLSRVLVLWDIDHTLIETRGVGRAIYQLAFKTAFDVELEQLAKMSGRTELDIMTETLRLTDWSRQTRRLPSWPARSLKVTRQPGMNWRQKVGR